jgi:drug/metabolite transporter (DMT)-like permease
LHDDAPHNRAEHYKLNPNFCIALAFTDQLYCRQLEVLYMLLEEIRPTVNPLHIQLKGTLLVALSGTLFGLIGYLGTQLFRLNFSVENMLFWRFVTASLWIYLLSFLNAKHSLKPLKKQLSLSKLSLLGIISYSGGSAFYFLAVHHLGTALAMVIFFSFPVFVTLFTWCFDQWQMNRYAMFSLLAVLSGLFILKGADQGHLDYTGFFLGLGAAFSYATYVYSSQHSIKTAPSNVITLLVCLGNALIFLTLSWQSHTFFVPSHPIMWLYICALGVFATALPIQLLLEGLKYISPVKASILSVLEPVVAIIVGLLVLHESFSMMQSLGVVILLLGAIVIQFERA